jgi:hypothetical protein
LLFVVCCLSMSKCHFAPFVDRDAIRSAASCL